MAKENKYIPKHYKIIDYIRESGDSFTIRVDIKTKHDAGQFVQVSLPGLGESPISISSYSDKYMDFNIREVGTVTNALSKMKKGDKILIRGPYGRGYPMKEFKGKNAVIVGGGCGVAPLRGVIDYIDKNKKDFGDIRLFMGFRTPDDILFKTQVEKWKKDYDFHLSVDKNPSNTCFNGSVGFVTNMLEKEKVKPDNTVAFVCGPPIMMKFVIKILQKQGFKDDQIWVSAERLMNCAIGLCGHCMIKGKYTCLDGPVFRYDEIKGVDEEL